jgi:Protein of unknown function (DUF2799)
MRAVSLDANIRETHMNRVTPSRYILALLPLLVLLPGCASMNKNECLTVDWQTVGYEDGAAGRSGDRIAQHRKACAKHGVAPDLKAYQAGREQGLREYCQPQNGYRLGERGADPVGFCPADLAMNFEDAYRDGFELYSLRARVSQAENDINNMRAERSRAQEDMVAASAVVVDPLADKAAKAQALLDVKRLAERQGVLKTRIAQREEDRQNFQRDLDHYLASAGPR